MKPRPHTFLTSRTVPADYRGRPVCQACGLPAKNAAHRDAQADDVSARIVGEGKR